jgi:hypothetical protein
MKLASGLKIADARKLILAFVEHWYSIYDGVPVLRDNELRITDIALSTMLNSRISGTTARLIFREKEPVEAALVEIPPDVDLLDVATEGEIPGASGIRRAIASLCAIRRVKLSTSTKILHKKRPGLIPILDSVVQSQYYLQWCPSFRGRHHGDYAIVLLQVVHKDMLSVASELRDLQSALAERRTPLTPCRILNALTWMAKAENEEWIVEQAESRWRLSSAP